MSRPTDTPSTEHRSGVRGLVVACLVLFVSGLTSFAGNIVLAVRFPDRPVPEDLMLRVLPYVKFAEYVTEVAIVGSLALIAVYAFRHARHELPDMIAVFGIMYLLRSFIMVLTPLASPNHAPGHFGITPIDQLGMFPSGHVAASLLVLLMIDGQRAPVMKRLALILMLTQWAAMLFAHGHYGIDIVGGILLGYFVWREWYDGVLFRPLQRLMESEERVPSGERAS